MSKITVKSVETDEQGNIVIICDVPRGKWADGLADDTHIDHPIILHPAAIANRMFAYGLDTKEEGIEAILREHCVRLGDIPPDNPKAHAKAVKAVRVGEHTIEDKVHLLGGLHSKATVSIEKSHLKYILDEHGDVVDYHFKTKIQIQKGINDANESA